MKQCIGMNPKSQAGMNVMIYSSIEYASKAGGKWNNDCRFTSGAPVLQPFPPVRLLGVRESCVLLSVLVPRALEQ